LKWFKHDTNAHTDAKLDKVLMHYGAKGYAVYWYCLELIAGKISSHNLSFELEHDAEQIGARLKVDSQEVAGILTYMVDLGLFEGSGERITCLKLFSRLDQSMTNSPALRKMISEGKISDKSGDVMTCHERLDKTRLDKTRQDKTKTPTRKQSRFTPPSRDECASYVEEKNLYYVDLNEFFNHYESNGWIVGRNKMKSWQATLRQWHLRREKERKATQAPRRTNV